MRKASPQFIIAVVVVVLVLGIGYIGVRQVLDQGEVREAVSEPMENEIEAEEKIDEVEDVGEEIDTSDWKTYRNVEYRFSFRYPSCLTIRKDKQGSIELISLDVRNQHVGGNFNLYNPSYADLSINYTIQESSFDQWKEERFNALSAWQLEEGTQFNKNYGGDGVAFYVSDSLTIEKIFLLNRHTSVIEVHFMDELTCLHQPDLKPIVQSFFDSDYDKDLEK